MVIWKTQAKENASLKLKILSANSFLLSLVGWLLRFLLFFDFKWLLVLLKLVCEKDRAYSLRALKILKIYSAEDCPWRWSVWDYLSISTEMIPR